MENKYLHVVYVPSSVSNAFTLSSPGAEFALVGGVYIDGNIVLPLKAPARAVIPGVQAVRHAPDLTELDGFFKFNQPLVAVVLATYSALPPLVTFTAPVTVTGYSFYNYDGDANTATQEIRISDGSVYRVTYPGDRGFPVPGFYVGADWPFVFAPEFKLVKV